MKYIYNATIMDTTGAIHMQLIFKPHEMAFSWSVIIVCIFMLIHFGDEDSFCTSFVHGVIKSILKSLKSV